MYEEPMYGLRSSLFVRALLFSLASNAAVLLTIQFGLLLWPERLPVNSQNIFWLASGVNVAGLLILGLRYWPVLLLNAFPVWLLGIEPLEISLPGSCTNVMEALFAAWLIRRAGAFTGQFDTLRSVGALVLASLVAPIINTVIIPAYLCFQGMYPWSEYGRALGNWNLSNGTAMLVLTPLIISIARRDWSAGARTSEYLIAVGAAVALCFIGFDGMFQGTGKNLAFLAFPPVIYTAVRFGIGETSAVLAVALLSVYGSLALHAHVQPPLEIPSTIWFVQALCWVLAATGLLVAVLSAVRRRAEQQSLQASLETERARLAVLRYQINPHFLFNSLNSVRAALPLSEAVPREMITDLAEFLRGTLDHPEVERIPLRDEIRNVQKYLNIEVRRFGDRLRVTFETDTAAEKLVPAFLLQPLVENAIRHGLETSWEPCVITITARCDGARLLLKVANTGRWREPGERRGTGLENVRRRLQILYGAQASLTVRTDNGVCVQIEIPA